MTLTKEQWIQLSNIFHKRCDGQIRVADFPAVVDIVEEFLSSQGILDNSEPDETPDEYLDRLTAE